MEKNNADFNNDNKNKIYDVIIIGAGSVGVPAGFSCSRDGLKTLVIESNPSVGQGENKHAIGGIRATHTQKSKIYICQKSINIFSNWKESFGDDIGWVQGGYCYVVYTKEHEELFKKNVDLQKSYGLNIEYYDSKKIKDLIPGISDEGLLGGTFSPEDGSASPLLAINAFYRQALKNGAKFRFNEEVIDIITENGKVIAVKTQKETYLTRNVINCAGGKAKEVGAMVGLDLPIKPTSHEAAITEPVEHFINPMIVDIRPSTDEKFGDSKNYYFYQNNEGQIVFCITPDPPIYGGSKQETSSFLPKIAKRIINLLPRLRYIKVRRTWRGLYPDTLDGSPIVGKVKEVEGYINAVGMCGQGYMLGPGLGNVIARIVKNQINKKDEIILDELSLYRDFGSEEMLK